MKHVLMVTIEVESDDELARAIDKVMKVRGVTDWTTDALPRSVTQELEDLGHDVTPHRRARSWTSVAKHRSG
jgi:hypothetical protein